MVYGYCCGKLVSGSSQVSIVVDHFAGSSYSQRPVASISIRQVRVCDVIAGKSAHIAAVCSRDSVAVCCCSHQECPVVVCLLNNARSWPFKGPVNRPTPGIVTQA